LSHPKTSVEILIELFDTVLVDGTLAMSEEWRKTLHSKKYHMSEWKILFCILLSL